MRTYLTIDDVLPADAAIPEDFTPWEGGPWLGVQPRQEVECLVRTAGGIGFSGNEWASLMSYWDWSENQDPDGNGNIVAFRLVAPTGG